MKKYISMLTAIAMVVVTMFLVSSCGASDMKIENYEWKMRTVMRNDIEAAQNEEDLVVAVGEADEIHPNAKIVDIRLTAKDGVITVTDETNDKTYSGTYKVQQKTPKGTDYEITIDAIKGYATVAPTEYYDGSAVPTLPINLGEYSLYFIPAE